MSLFDVYLGLLYSNNYHMTSTPCANTIFTCSLNTMLWLTCDYVHIYIDVVCGFPLWAHVEISQTFLNTLHYSSWAAPKWLHVLSGEIYNRQLCNCPVIPCTHINTLTITQMASWRLRIRPRCERNQMKDAAPPSSPLRSGGDWKFLHLYLQNVQYTFSTTFDSCWDISFKATIVNPLVALEEKSGDHQSLGTMHMCTRFYGNPLQI